MGDSDTAWYDELLNELVFFVKEHRRLPKRYETLSGGRMTWDTALSRNKVGIKQLAADLILWYLEPAGEE